VLGAWGYGPKPPTPNPQSPFNILKIKYFKLLIN